MCHKTLTFSIDDLKEDKKKSAVQLSLGACYLYISVPFKSAHHIVVEITVVPFCLPSYPGQTFYYASPSYARCCSSAQQHEFLPKVIDVACKLYQLNVHCHSWNFDVPQSWSVCRESDDDILHNASCLQRSVWHLEYLTGRRNKPQSINQLPTRASPEPTVCYGMSPENASAQIPPTSTSIEVHTAARSKEKGNSGDVFLCPKPASADSMTSSLHVADEFLKALEEVDTSQINSRYCSAFVQLHLPAHDEHENRAARAWRLCTMAAKWAQRHLENARYTRFISLCFFLVWESLSCKAGKAGAREINARMRQAGFEGTSRSFKSLRDETVLINQLIASVEHVHGTEAASVIMWHIFGRSNYHMIRTMNRFSKAKKHFAVAYISRKATFPSFLQLPILNRRVQDIIAEQLADLHPEEINRAIHFQALNMNPSFPLTAHCAQPRNNPNAPVNTFGETKSIKDSDESIGTPSTLLADTASSDSISGPTPASQATDRCSLNFADYPESLNDSVLIAELPSPFDTLEADLGVWQAHSGAMHFPLDPPAV